MSAYRDSEGLRADLGRDGALRLVLDRPQKRNALDDAMVSGLISVLDLAGRDEAVRAILITGAGGHFCGGFDILARNAPAPGTEGGASGSERPRGGAERRSPGSSRPRVGSIQRRLPSEAHRLIPLVTSIQVPVVCAVRGWAAGIGLHLAVAADFCVAAEDARLWEPFAERGFTPDSGGTWLLPRRVGEVHAREMLLLGRVVDGREAEQWGLVHRCVKPEFVESEAEAIVARLAEGPTVALGLTKWLMHAGTASNLEVHLRSEALSLELSSRSEDFREGVAAFAEKRDPRFKGR